MLQELCWLEGRLVGEQEALRRPRQSRSWSSLSPTGAMRGAEHSGSCLRRRRSGAHAALESAELSKERKGVNSFVGWWLWQQSEEG